MLIYRKNLKLNGIHLIATPFIIFMKTLDN
jgi:hypothetical protein